MSNNTKVAKKKSTDVSTNTLSDLESFAGQGTENIGARDVKLPIIKVLSRTTPNLDEIEEQYGAKPGDILNEVTGSFWNSKKGMLVVPCHYVNTFIEWADRGSSESTGAPIQIHRDAAIMQQTNRADDGKDRLENGHYVEDTANHFVYILDDEYNAVETALITMKSTQKKKSRVWNTMMMSKKLKGSKGFFVPPTWATVYRLTTVKEENSKGQWYGWSITFDRFLDKPTDEATLQSTMAFSDSSKKLDLMSKVDYSEGEPKAPNNTQPPKTDGEMDGQNIPF
tara:strand:+ start:2654 stop:3499 length:846 start_codon:yes stop_codon:yes gene_type:complete